MKCKKCGKSISKEECDNPGGGNYDLSGLCYRCAVQLSEKLGVFPIGIGVVIVADDFKGYGKKTKYVGQKGTIIGWKPNLDRPDGKIPEIRLNSGETICDKKIWWQLSVI